MRIADMNWMQVRDHVAHATTAPCCRSARPSSTPICRWRSTRSWPSGSRSRRPSRSRCRSSRCSTTASHRASSIFPGTVTPADVDPVCAVVTDVLDGIARSGFKPHRASSTAMAATRRRTARCSNGSTAIPACQVKWHNWWNAPQHLGDGAGDRPGGLARVLDGELPLDAARRRRHAGDAKPMMRSTRFRSSIRGARRNCSATAISAAATSAATTEMLSLWKVAVEETRARDRGRLG